MASNVGIAVPVAQWPQITGSQDSLSLGGLGMPPEIALQEQALNRKQQLANVLMQRALQPIQGVQAGRFYAPPNWAQGLAQLGTAGLGAYMSHRNEQTRKDLSSQSNNMLAEALKSYQGQVAPHEVETQPADTRSVNGSGVSPQLPFGIDPNVMPSQGFDINTYQPDTTQQVQANKNAIALNTPQPQAPPEQPLAGVPQQMNPWTTELTGQPNVPEPQAPLVDALQQRYDQGEQYTRQPFQQPQSQVTVSPSETQMMERTPQEKQAALVQLMASQHPQARAIAQFMAQQEQQKAQLEQQQAFTHGENEARNQVTMRGQDTQAANAAATIQNTMAMKEMQIAQMERSGQDATALKRDLVGMQADLQKQLHSMDIQSRERQTQMVVDAKKDIAGQRTQLSPKAQSELFEADEGVQAAKGVLTALDQAIAMNDKAYDGIGAKERATIATNIPGMGKAGADATIELDNLVTNQALGQLKATFGGMPTEGERKILLDVQGSVNLGKEQRKAIWERAKIATKRRQDFNEKKAKALRDNTYFQENFMEAPEAPAAPANGGWSITPIP